MSNKKLNATITIGGAVTAGLRSAIGSTVDGLRKIGSTIREVQRQQADVGRAIEANRRTGQSVVALEQQYSRLGQSIDRMRQAQQRLAANHNATQSNLSNRADYRSKIGETVAIGAIAGSPIVIAAKFEKAMLGVAKQVEGARDKSGKLTAVYHDMAKQIQLLGRETPLATNEIADMVAAGARMGIVRNELIEFTKTSAMMASAFELPAGELAESMGKIRGLFGYKTQAEVRALADSINYLDDNAISKGADIIEFLTRTGALASNSKVTGAGMAALGSTLLTLGERTETAATATNAFFSKLAAAEKGTKKFRSAMKEIGLSTKVIQKGMQTDAQGTVLKVLGAINRLPADKRTGVIVELVGQDHQDTISKLAGKVEEYRKQIALASSEEAKGSMSREYEAQRATTIAQWTMLKNKVGEVAVNLGSVLLPTVNRLMSVVGNITTGIAEWAKAHPKLTQAVVGTVVALTSMKVAGWAVGYAWTFAKGAALAAQGAYLRVGAAMTTVAATTTKITGLVRAMGVVFAMSAMPLWLVAAAGSAVAAVGVTIWKYWEPIKAFFVGFGTGLVEGFAPVAKALSDAFAPVWNVIQPLVMPVLEAVGGVVRGIATWFGDLFTPIDKASQTTVAFGEAGKVCGQVVGEAFRFMLTPIEAVAKMIVWIRDNIGSVIDAASKVGSVIGGGWQKTKEFFGGEAAPAGAPAPAAVPPMRGGAGGTSTNTTNVGGITIVQQPGQDSKALADEVARRIEQRNAVRSRSSMADRAF